MKNKTTTSLWRPTMGCLFMTSLMVDLNMEFHSINLVILSKWTLSFQAWTLVTVKVIWLVTLILVAITTTILTHLRWCIIKIVDTTFTLIKCIMLVLIITTTIVKFPKARIILSLGIQSTIQFYTMDILKEYITLFIAKLVVICVCATITTIQLMNLHTCSSK